MNEQDLGAYLVPIREDGKILMVKRFNGFWEFPGGGVEFGENPKETAIRECKEETGLEARDLKMIGITSAVYKKDRKDKHSVYIVYKGKVKNKPIKLTGEHIDYKWIKKGEEKELNLGLNVKDIFNMDLNI